MNKIAIYGQNYIKETTQIAVEKLIDVLLEKEAKFLLKAIFSNQKSTVKTNAKVKHFSS